MPRLNMVLSFGGTFHTSRGTPKNVAIQSGRKLLVEPTHEGVYDIQYTTDSNNDEWVSYVPFSDAAPSTDVYKQIAGDGLISTGGSSIGRLPCGLAVILGAAGSGKTRFLPTLASALSARHVIIGEPVPGSLPFDPAALCGVIEGALDGGSTVVDSMRLATFGGSQLGPGGIPRDMGGFLSHVDYACRLTSSLIVGVVNILSTDERAIESAREVISGSVSVIINTLGIRSEKLGHDVLVGEIQVRPDQRRPLLFKTDIRKV
jgi:hypothetical protein